MNARGGVQRNRSARRSVHSENSFVVCEVRRPLLSMGMLEDKGIHLTARNWEAKVERSVYEDKETPIL